MRRSLLAMGLIIALLPLTSQASEYIGRGGEKGFYIGAAVGNTNLNLSSTAFGDAGSKDETGFKLTGGYQFHKFFAAELSYYNPGDFSDSSPEGTIKVSADIFEASLVGMFPIVGPLSAFGRAGVAKWDGKLSATSSDGFTGAADDDGSDFNWELGLQLAINRHFRLRGSFEQTKIDTNIADVLPVTWRVRFYQVAAIYQF